MRLYRQFNVKEHILKFSVQQTELNLLTRTPSKNAEERRYLILPLKHDYIDVFIHLLLFWEYAK